MAIEDWPLKLTFLRSFAERDISLEEDAAFFRYYWPEIGHRLRSVQNRFDKWGSSAIRAGAGSDFIEHVISKLGFEGTTSEFKTLPYDQWVHRVALPKPEQQCAPAAAEDRICIFLDPDHHPLAPEEEWEKTGIVDQRFMYISRLAVLDWLNLIEDGRYVTYNLCQQTLIKTLENPAVFNGISTVVLLGAGSYSKDRMIVEAVTRHSLGKHVRVIIVDASFYMLVDTYRRMREYIRRMELNSSVEMYCFDFSDAAAWQRNVSFSNDERVAAFILGGTVGNLREAHFFNVVRDVFVPGTAFVIAGEFFHSAEEIESARPRLLERYRQDAAKDLSLTAVNDLLNRETVVKSVAQRRNFVDVDMRPALGLPGNLSSAVPDTMSVFFKTKGPIRNPGRNFPSLYLVTSKRYVREHFISTVHKASGLSHLETIVHPGGELFSHLVFVKEPHRE